MSLHLDRTHDASLRSWVSTANPVEGQVPSDFPIQNLPYAVFRRRASHEAWRGGVAIGDQVLDLSAVLAAELLPSEVRETLKKASQAPLNDFMATSSQARKALRSALFDLLKEGSALQAQAAHCLIAQADIEHDLAARVENFSDFYSSIHHATNVGALFRPDNPILPNYRWLPVGYTGRVSSLKVSGTNVRRPWGQLKAPDADTPTYAPCKRLDYEVELGMLISQGSELGSKVDIRHTDEHIFGVCLLNDWSARDIQTWEYQPLGPMLSKSFLTNISPWIVTLEALEPFRTGFQRPAGEPEPLPHLWSADLSERGSIDIRLQMYLQTAQMQRDGQAAQLVSDSRFTDAYWSMGQLIAHQTSNGANLCPGDLLGSGTLSGPEASSRACLLEMTQGGKVPFQLANGEQRSFLEDGDTVIMRGYCDKPGAARIGLGECRSTVIAALPA